METEINCMKKKKVILIYSSALRTIKHDVIISMIHITRTKEIPLEKFAVKFVNINIPVKINNRIL